MGPRADHELYTIKDVGRELRIHYRTVQLWRDQGRFPWPEIDEPGFMRWTRKQVFDWIESMKRKGEAA